MAASSFARSRAEVEAELETRENSYAGEMPPPSKPGKPAGRENSPVPAPGTSPASDIRHTKAPLFPPRKKTDKAPEEEQNNG